MPVEKPDWGTLRWLSNPTTTQSSGNLTGLEVIISSFRGHDFHVHPNQEEIIYVIEGEIEQWIEREKRILTKGDVAFIPKNAVYASFQFGESPTKLLVALSPYW